MRSRTDRIHGSSPSSLDPVACDHLYDERRIALQTERAVGERSLSGRGARAGRPPSGLRWGGAGEGPAGDVADGGAESWTLIGDDQRPVAPVERYLAWLSRIERSPNTVRAYAQDLKTFWAFLTARGLEWDRGDVEQLGEFTAWLRQPAENVIVLAERRPRRSARTVNRMLSAVFGFYEFHARHGVAVARALVDATRSGRGGYKPFLHGIARPGRVGASAGCARSSGCRGRCRWSRSQRSSTRSVACATGSCSRCCSATGMRIGQALGLRHERPRRRTSGGSSSCRARTTPTARAARARAGRSRSRRAGALLLGLHARGVRRARLRLRVREPVGRADRPADALCERRRRSCGARAARVGFDFTAHQFRHTYATLARRGGVPIEVVSRLLTPRVGQTTTPVSTCTAASRICAQSSSGQAGCRELGRPARERERRALRAVDGAQRGARGLAAVIARRGPARVSRRWRLRAIRAIRCCSGPGVSRSRGCVHRPAWRPRPCAAHGRQYRKARQRADVGAWLLPAEQGGRGAATRGRPRVRGHGLWALGCGAHVSLAPAALAMAGRARPQDYARHAGAFRDRRHGRRGVRRRGLRVSPSAARSALRRPSDAAPGCTAAPAWMPTRSSPRWTSRAHARPRTTTSRACRSHCASELQFGVAMHGRRRAARRCGWSGLNDAVAAARAAASLAAGRECTTWAPALRGAVHVPALRPARRLEVALVRYATRAPGRTWRPRRVARRPASPATCGDRALGLPAFAYSAPRRSCRVSPLAARADQALGALAAARGHLGRRRRCWNLPRTSGCSVEFCRTAARRSAPRRDTYARAAGGLARARRRPGARANHQHTLVGALKVLLDDVRANGWAPGLPPTATYHRGELPRQARQRAALPRRARHRQIEAPREHRAAPRPDDAHRRRAADRDRAARDRRDAPAP